MSFVIMGVLAYCLPYGWLFLSVFMAAVIYEPKKEDSQGVLFSMDYEAGRGVVLWSYLQSLDEYDGDGLIVVK